MWFGNYLTPQDGLRVIKGDVRDTASIPLDDVDAVIHLSSVANDPCGDLDPQLTWEISCLSTMRLADKAVRMGVKHFIYASSGSVYGVKTEQQVTEDLELLPLSEYNKTKMVGERVLLSYSKDMIVQIVRPATVCGLSPRMRLDVSVNLLTMQALTKNEITVLGGDQTRPNIHIDDITDLYLFLLRRPELQGIYNAGFENMSINDMALLIQASTNAEILKMPSNDPRSYRLNSDKLLATGFSPQKNVDIAIKEICTAYQRGELENKPQFNNLLYMQTEVFK
jgi:nucleoside-diphosphate-sugar epimerase